jgi:uncharacterized delta-60 repeat protein
VSCPHRESEPSRSSSPRLEAWARRCRQALGGALIAGVAVLGWSSPIQYTLTGTGSGSLGTLGFVNSTVTITGVSDTSNIVAASGTLYCNRLTSVTFSAGTGMSGAIVESLNVFVNTTTSTIGFQFGTSCPVGNDWFDSSRAAFATWHLGTEIGPVALEPFLSVTNWLHTTRGPLTLLGLSDATFRASASVAAPEARAGLFDPTFANAGKAVYPAPPEQSSYAYVLAMVVQPDAAIAFSGWTNSEIGSIRRLTASGGIDPTFGTGGKASAVMSYPFALALQADGKLVAGGNNGHAALARLMPTGAPDPTFGTDGSGMVTTPLGLGGGYVFKVLVQPDGKLIAVGSTNSGGSTTQNTGFIARYLPNGTLDTTFGGGGVQTFVGPGGTTVTVFDAALQSDGKIVVVGTRLPPAVPILFRFTADGQVDGTFATTAPATAGMAIIVGVGVLPDGKLLLAGEGPGTLQVLRLNANGTPDATYGTGGLTSVPLTGGKPQASVVQPDGKVVVLLQDGPPAPVPQLKRFTAAGTLDASFGTGGTFNVTNADKPYLRALALQADGKILAGGEVDTGTAPNQLAHQAVFRFQGDPITGTIVEFFNSLLSHFFITASAVEQASIDAGGSGPGWSRTGLTFKSGGVSRACRFYGTPGVGPNSHFYTLEPAECAQVRRDPGWHFESYDFSATPAGADGGCLSGTVPVFRAYNQRFAQNDSNHRYAALPFAYNTQVDSTGAGWTPEGVVFCVPQ